MSLDLGLYRVTPQVGLEPTTLRLTAECSAIELLRIVTPARMEYPARAWNFIAEGSRGCQTAVPACAGGAVWGIIWVRKPVVPTLRPPTSRKPLRRRTLSVWSVAQLRGRARPWGWRCRSWPTGTRATRS